MWGCSRIWCRPITSSCRCGSFEAARVRGERPALSLRAAASTLSATADNGSPPATELLQHRRQRAVFRFGHAENVLPLVLQLGLYRDEDPPTAETAVDIARHRLWRTSRIAPFGTNLAVVLYGCSMNEEDHTGRNRTVGLFVQIRHNEQPVAVPHCTTDDTTVDLQHACPLETFQARFAPLLQKTFDSVCA